MTESGEPYRVLTERLDLRAVSQDDLDALFTINHDPRTWSHEPAGRHSSPETTRNWIARAITRWETAGLSYWTARLRGTGEVVGIGGAQRFDPYGYWNLYYRLDPAHWGHGYATELARAAQAAAYRMHPELPFMAWILAHNTASRAVAERIGLTDHGVSPFPGNSVPMHAYADRPISFADFQEH